LVIFRTAEKSQVSARPEKMRQAHLGDVTLMFRGENDHDFGNENWF